MLKDLFVPETIVIKPANNSKSADEYFLKKYDPESYTTEQTKLTRDQLKQITERNEVYIIINKPLFVYLSKDLKVIISLNI